MIVHKIYRAWTLTVLAISTFQASAIDVKDFTFSHLGKEEGVDNQRIFSLLQMPSGAIWWSSMTGIGRYNGSKVRNYQLNDNTPFSHMGGRVIQLSADSSAIYAFDNRGSIFKYCRVHDHFDFVSSISSKKGHDVALNDIYISRNNLFLAMHDGVYLLRNDSLTQIIKDIYVNKIISVKDRLLFCAREGIYDKTGKRLLPYNTVCGYYDNLSDRLWVGGYENGLHLVSLSKNGDIKSDLFVRLTSTKYQQDKDKASSLGRNPIRSIYPYDDETMLIGIDGEGVFKAQRDGRGEGSLLFDANDTQHGKLHGNGVYSIITDTWKNIVIGTYSGGIDIARPVGSTKAIYNHVGGSQQSLLNDHVNMVLPLSNDMLIMGTDNGISILNTRTNQWRHCCQGTVALSASMRPNGNVLVSTYGKGIYEIDNQANVYKHYTTENSPLKDMHVYTTFFDKDGDLWVGSLDGDLLNMTKGGYKYYPIHDVQSITQLVSGQIAIGTAFGLKLLTPGSDTITDLDYTPTGVTNINPFITHLLASGMELWIATDGGGVYVYHMTKHESRQITTANGLPSNYVRSLVKGRDGRIWIATDEGLSFVMPDTDKNKVINANFCYGFEREYSRSAGQTLADGDIIFGTTTGAIIIHPENVQPLNYTAKLSFSGVNCPVDQEEIQSEQVYKLLDNGELNLSYHQRTFYLLFESVNMRNHFDIAYRYKIGNGEWSTPTDQQYIHFVNLEPGEHQLTLQCISRTSGIVIDSKPLLIIIGQPWWNSWWMWCIYIAFVVLAFYGAWKVYELHEKYMRLTIDSLKAQEVKNSTPSSQSEAESPDNTSDAKGTDSDFVDKATRIIAAHISDSEFTIDSLCREMAMSRTLFYVKLKSYTGKSPQDFMRIIRLERAASMLRSGYTVSDSAALTGFDNPKYFSTVFKKYFGISPSKYQ